MTKKIYVGNLPFSYGFKELKSLFEKFGETNEVLVIADRFNGRSKGFGFVTFAKEEDAKKAIEEMNGEEADGRVLKVREATPKKEDREIEQKKEPEKTKEIKK